MVKFWVVIFSIVLTGISGEPPSNYGPPQARNSLSDRYNAPPQQNIGRRSSGSFSYNSIAETQFSGSSQNRLRTSNNRQQSDVPNAFSQPRNSFGSQARLSSTSASGVSGFSAQSRQLPSVSSIRQESSSYSGAAGQQPAGQYGPPSPVYGAPRMLDDDLAEPANYEYNYQVAAAEEFGPEFGHQETREDDSAHGEYNVILPDGRRQIVEYEADEEGFRPRIRYEETGYPNARETQGPY